MTWNRCVLCIVALLASSAKAQDEKVDPSLPRYRPIAGVIGDIKCHESAAKNKLMTLWGRGFERIYPNARVELDDVGWESVDGGAATFGPGRGLQPEREVKKFRKRFGYAPMQVPVCIYMLAVFVHKSNPCKEGLPLESVKAIFSTYVKDYRWGHLGYGGEWSKRAIKLHAPDSRRCFDACYFLRERFGLDFNYKRSVIWWPDNAAVVASVAKDPRGMGLAEIGYQTEKVRALPIAPIGGSKLVPATPANAESGAYPLSVPFYLMLNHDPHAAGLELDPLRREFLRYILSREGQQAVIKAGHVPLSASAAKGALEKVGLTPTGEGSWDRLIARLRKRISPRKRMYPIERFARKIGDRPSHKQLVSLASTLAATGLTSSVTFETDKEGATVKYRLIGQADATATGRPTKDAKATVPVGFYYVWTERDGNATSPKGAWFQIIREHERIRIYESQGTSINTPK